MYVQFSFFNLMVQFSWSYSDLPIVGVVKNGDSPKSDASLLIDHDPVRFRFIVGISLWRFLLWKRRHYSNNFLCLTWSSRHKLRACMFNPSNRRYDVGPRASAHPLFQWELTFSMIPQTWLHYIHDDNTVGHVNRWDENPLTLWMNCVAFLQ